MMLWILLGCVLCISVLNHLCICCMYISLMMTENMTEIDLEYAEDILIVNVPEAFTNSLLSSPCPRQAPMHNPTFQHLLCLLAH